MFKGDFFYVEVHVFHICIFQILGEHLSTCFPCLLFLNYKTRTHSSDLTHWNQRRFINIIIIIVDETRPCEQGNWDTWMVLDP